MEKQQSRPLLFVAVSLTLAPLNTLSDDLLDCVDPDVVSAFLSGGYYSTRQIADELPNEFTAQYPEDFLFVGNSISETVSSVAFRTGREPVDAVSVVEEELRSQGWHSLPQRRRSSRGFQEAEEAVARPVPLCHSDGRSMTISAHREDRGTYVILSRRANAEGYNCNDEGDAHDPWSHGLTGELMPTLELPGGAKYRGSGSGGIIRGSGDDAETHVRLTSNLRSDKILEHFSSQLVSQGWILDSTWVGKDSAGSTWNLSRDKLPKTVGTLQLFTHSDGDYTIRFSMLAI